MTATEAFAAMRASASGLNPFSAFRLGPDGLSALLSAVLVYAVGGVGAAAFAVWLQACAAPFGLGSALYAPGMSAEAVDARARSAVAAWDDVH